MAASRIYIVKTSTGEHLVQAQNPSRAIRFVTTAGVTCDAASSLDVARLMGAGVKLLDATGPDAVESGVDSDTAAGLTD